MAMKNLSLKYTYNRQKDFHCNNRWRGVPRDQTLFLPLITTRRMLLSGKERGEGGIVKELPESVVSYEGTCDSERLKEKALR